VGPGRPEENVAGQPSDVAQQLQKDRASRPHHRTDNRLPGRLDRAASDLQTQVRQESRGVRRRGARVLGKSLHFHCHALN